MYSNSLLLTRFLSPKLFNFDEECEKYWPSEGSEKHYTLGVLEWLRYPSSPFILSEFYISVARSLVDQKGFFNICLQNEALFAFGIPNVGFIIEKALKTGVCLKPFWFEDIRKDTHAAKLFNETSLLSKLLFPRYCPTTMFCLDGLSSICTLILVGQICINFYAQNNGLEGFSLSVYEIILMVQIIGYYG